MMYALILAAAVGGMTTSTPADDSLRVMAWNVLHGANDVEQGAEKTLAIIRDANPDIVLMQESYDIDGDRPKLGKWLSEQLDWNYHQAESPHLCVLTPLKLEAEFFHHQWHGLGALLTDEQGRSCLAWSIGIDLSLVDHLQNLLHINRFACKQLGAHLVGSIWIRWPVHVVHDETVLPDARCARCSD